MAYSYSPVVLGNPNQLPGHIFTPPFYEAMPVKCKVYVIGSSFYPGLIKLIHELSHSTYCDDIHSHKRAIMPKGGDEPSLEQPHQTHTFSIHAYSTDE